MVDDSTLKKLLMQSGQFTEEMIARAEDYALTSGMALDEAVIFLKMINYASLGLLLSDFYQKPYLPLLGQAPAENAKAKIPLKMAEGFHVFPVDYDAKKNSLKVAVGNPDDPDLMRNLRRLVPNSAGLDVIVASRPEIRLAIDVYYKGKPYIPERELSLPKGFTIVSEDKKAKESLDLDEETKSGTRILLMEPDLERSRALMSLLRKEGFVNVQWVSSVKEAVKAIEDQPVDRVVANGRVFKPQATEMKPLSRMVKSSLISFYNIRNMLLAQEYGYPQMSAALMALVTFIVRNALRDQPELLSEIATTARYCKLLSMRMGLPAVSVDGAVLAAWLSAPDIGKTIYEHMPSPYPLEEIFSPEKQAQPKTGLEAAILLLVKNYLELKKTYPDIAGDMDKVRKALALSKGVAEEKALLEAFLNVLKDEEFLKDVGRSRRRILIVDRDYSPDSAMVLRLMNDGYDVSGVPDARQAVKIIFDSGADLVISEVNLPQTDGLRFCRALRENPASAHLPFFFVAHEEGQRLATQCLEAGADDFFKKPPDLEMLSIKIRNILALKSSRGAKQGISGALKDMSFTDIIQSLTTGDKDVEIRLYSGDKQGLIYIQQGEVIFAQAQDVEGQEAFYRMMAWTEGEFEIKTCNALPERNIFESAMSLLMEGARIVDDESELPDDEEG
jgi:DNA-binding response OmpR family regulator